MKRIIILFCAVMLVGVMLCSCTGQTAEKVKDKASEAVADIKDDMKDNPTEKRETVAVNETTAPTEGSMLETIADAAMTEWDDMKENGKVNDGDGNVGELEKNDGDGNPAPEKK